MMMHIHFFLVLSLILLISTTSWMINSKNMQHNLFQTTRSEHQPPSRQRSLSIHMAGGQTPMVPYYPDKLRPKEYQWMDIYNALGRERTLFVGRFLDDESSNQLIASLIWLQGLNSKEPITMYFNVPGAISKPALAVYDTMRRMSCPLHTVNIGLTVGTGALLCSMGTMGKRSALPNSRFLMSRTGMEDAIQGQSVEISLAVTEVMKDNIKVQQELAKLCGQPLVKIQEDMKRDFYLTAAEAVAYGLIDTVMKPEQPVKMMRYRGADDAVVNFGHFAEVRKLQTGPNDVVVPYKETNENEFDDFAASEMAKKGYKGRVSDRIDPKSLRNGGGANRFANSRCKPPGSYKPKTNLPPPIDPKTGLPLPPDNPFVNTGW